MEPPLGNCTSRKSTAVGLKFGIRPLGMDRVVAIMLVSMRFLNIHCRARTPFGSPTLPMLIILPAFALSQPSVRRISLLAALGLYISLPQLMPPPTLATRSAAASANSSDDFPSTPAHFWRKGSSLANQPPSPLPCWRLRSIWWAISNCLLFR